MTRHWESQGEEQKKRKKAPQKVRQQIKKTKQQLKKLQEDQDNGKL